MHQQLKVGLIRDFFERLYAAWGPQHWWPAESRFEVIVGAFLTQNTAWRNVELALANLRAAGVLDQDAIRRAPVTELEQLIRPAGFFRQKAQRLKTFIAYLDNNYAGSLEDMFGRPTGELRKELLKLNGVGPETADSILLYAGNHEAFVVDAYTRRILNRHGILPEDAHDDQVRALFHEALTQEFASRILATRAAGPTDEKARGGYHAPSVMSEQVRSARAQAMNEMHGLMVGVAKHYCRSRRTSCDECPLGTLLDSPVKLPLNRKKG